MKALIIRILLIFFSLSFFYISPLPAQDQKRLDSLIFLLEKASNDTIKIRQLVAISAEYSFNNIPLSLDYAHKALSLAEKGDNESLLAFTLFNLGITYYNQGFLEISLKYFYRYLEIQKKKNDTKGTAYALVNLGAIRVNLEEYEQAREDFENALETFNKLYDENAGALTGAEVIPIYNNLGVVYKNLKNPEKAIDYLLRGVSLGRKIPGQETYLANLLNNLGDLYLDQGKTKEAFENLNEALQIRLKIDDKTGMVNSYRMMATYFNKQNEKDKALGYLYQGLDLAGRIGSISLKADITEMMFQHFYDSHLSDSALKYKMLLTDIKDKLNQEATRKELAHLELTSQLEEKERMLQFEQKRKELRYLLTGLALVLLLSVISFLYFLSQSRVRRLRLEKENINLTSKNLELEKSNLIQELEIKNKELATNVMYQIQKNEIINEIGQKLNQNYHLISKGNQEMIFGIIKDLEKTRDTNIWNEFEIRFQQVHNEFYDKLNAINPELSLNDRRLCAFLKLNMTTKEICSITGQSIRSIEVARTRLRKKLDLTNSETGLIEFLSKL